MDSFYLFLDCRDSLNLHKNNSASQFDIELPKAYALDGNWECALKEISLTFAFQPESDRLYVCCDFLEESYARNTLVPVLRNVTVDGDSARTITFADPFYAKVKSTDLRRLTVFIKDSELKPVTFERNDLYCVLHLRKTWDR